MTISELELGPIGQISRSVQDVEQAEHWYKNVLGLEHLYTFGKLCFFDCAGTEERMAFLDDPEGRTLALISQVRPRQP